MRTLIKLLILSSSMIGLMILGTITYHMLEGWRFVDSFYFTGVTVTTIGYGDLTPVTDEGKIFTVFFAFAGVGITLSTIMAITQHYFQRKQKKFGRKMENDIVAYLKKRKKINTRKRRHIISGSRL
ncbi:MAG TPA: potassium channel family protein [archaeon]|nr:potassium channel family protein [archaeon]